MVNWFAIVYALVLFAIPVFFAIFLNRKVLITYPKKILYRMPIIGLISSFFISVAIEIYFVLDFYINKPIGDAAMGPTLWPVFALAYIFISGLLTFLISLGFYSYFCNRSKIAKKKKR